MVIHPFTGNGVGIGHGSTCQVLFHCIFLYGFMMLLSYQGDYNYVFKQTLILFLYPNKFLPSILFFKKKASIFAKFLAIDLLTFEH